VVLFTNLLNPKITAMLYLSAGRRAIDPVVGSGVDVKPLVLGAIQDRHQRLQSRRCDRAFRHRRIDCDLSASGARPGC
jgi:hypothetical protein